MYVTYSPDGGEPQTWEFFPGRVRVSEQVMIEKRCELRYDEWIGECRVGRASARRVLLWHLLRREHPALRWEDTPDFTRDELQVEMDVVELTEARESIEGNGALSDEDRALALAEVDRLIEDSIAKYGAGESGKAHSKSGPAPTPGPSPTPSGSAPGTSESG